MPTPLSSDNYGATKWLYSKPKVVIDEKEDEPVFWIYQFII